MTEIFGKCQLLNSRGRASPPKLALQKIEITEDVMFEQNFMTDLFLMAPDLKTAALVTKRYNSNFSARVDKMFLECLLTANR